MAKSLDPTNQNNMTGNQKHHTNNEVSSNEHATKKEANPVAKTIGFFSGGSETESDQFKSLKSQLSGAESNVNDLAFGSSNIDEMGFGAGMDLELSKVIKMSELFLSFQMSTTKRFLK